MRSVEVFWDDKWLLNGIFSKMPSDKFRGDMDSRVVAKFCENGPSESWRNIVCTGLVQASPNFVLLGRSHLKFHCWNYSVVVPWLILNVCQIWSGSVAVCQSYYGKIAFSGRQSDYNTTAARWLLAHVLDSLSDVNNFQFALRPLFTKCVGREIFNI